MSSGADRADFSDRAEDSVRREEERLASQQREESVGGLWAPSPVVGLVFAACLAAAGFWMLSQDGNVGRGSGVPPELGWFLLAVAPLPLAMTAIRALRSR